MTLRELSIYYKLHERLEQNRQMLSSLYTAAGLGGTGNQLGCPMRPEFRIR